MNWILRHQDGHKGRDGNGCQTCCAGLQIHGERCMMFGVFMITIILVRILRTGNKINLHRPCDLMAVLIVRGHRRSLMVTHKPTLHSKYLCATHDQNGQ